MLCCYNAFGVRNSHASNDTEGYEACLYHSKHRYRQANLHHAAVRHVTNITSSGKSSRVLADMMVQVE